MFHFMVASLLLFLTLNACQPPDAVPRRTGSEVVQSPVQLVVRLTLPAGLRRGTAKFRRLWEKVSYLQFEISTRDGFRVERTFPPESWEALQLSDIDFPRSASDSISIVASAWVPTRDGLVKVLVGEAKIDAKAADPAGRAEAGIKLRILVPLERWL
jgi:hypothetical protein